MFPTRSSIEGLKNTFRLGPGFGTVTTAALDNLAKLNDAAGKPAKTVVIVMKTACSAPAWPSFMNAELPKRGFEVVETIAHPDAVARHARRTSPFSHQVAEPGPPSSRSSYYGEFLCCWRAPCNEQRRSVRAGIYAVLNGAASNFRFVKELPDAANLVGRIATIGRIRGSRRRRDGSRMPRRRMGASALTIPRLNYARASGCWPMRGSSGSAPPTGRR